MPSLKLSDLFRRDPDRTDLKQRAATLKASLGKRPDAQAQPAPGSDEAKAAFKAACHQHTIRTQFANGYPELKRTPLEWWTASSLSGALETGELTPAECARLYPLATERELRMAEIEHELNLGGLFALAFADEYPVSPVADDPDPIHAAIAESYRAEDEMKAFGEDPAATSRPRWFLRERALTEAQSEARNTVWRTTPTTRAGRLALIEYARFQVALFTGDSVEDPDCPAYLFREIMGAITAAFEADCVPTSGSVTPDLHDASINQLARFHDCLQSLAFLVGTACNAPKAWGDSRETTNSICELLEVECQRLDDLAAHVVREIGSRTPRHHAERDDRLSTLAKRELEVAANLTDRTLMTEIAAAWGTPTP